MSKNTGRKRRAMSGTEGLVAAQRAQRGQHVAGSDVVKARVPGNVSVRREAPGLYSVHVNVSVMLLGGGTLRPLAGHVRRDRTTRLWAADDGPAEHKTRDDAVRVLLERARR